MFLLFVSHKNVQSVHKVMGIVLSTLNGNSEMYGLWYHRHNINRSFIFFPDTIGPKDVGLKDESLEDERGHGLFGFSALNRVDRWAQPITYVDIHEGQHFTVR